MKRLGGEWEDISQKESELSKLQAEARAKLSDAESREISLKYREERLDQEKVFKLFVSVSGRSVLYGMTQFSKLFSNFPPIVSMFFANISKVYQII